MVSKIEWEMLLSIINDFLANISELEPLFRNIALWIIDNQRGVYKGHNYQSISIFLRFNILKWIIFVPAQARELRQAQGDSLLPWERMISTLRPLRLMTMTPPTVCPCLSPKHCPVRLCLVSTDLTLSSPAPALTVSEPSMMLTGLPKLGLVMGRWHNQNIIENSCGKFQCWQ